MSGPQPKSPLGVPARAPADFPIGGLRPVRIGPPADDVSVKLLTPADMLQHVGLTYRPALHVSAGQRRRIHAAHARADQLTRAVEHIARSRSPQSLAEWASRIASVSGMCLDSGHDPAAGAGSFATGGIVRGPALLKIHHDYVIPNDPLEDR